MFHARQREGRTVDCYGPYASGRRWISSRTTTWRVPAASRLLDPQPRIGRCCRPAPDDTLSAGPSELPTLPQLTKPDGQRRP